MSSPVYTYLPLPTPATPREEPLTMNATRVANTLGISKRTLYRMLELGLLPQPIRLSRKVTFWRRVDIVAHLDRLAAQAAAATGRARQEGGKP